MFQPVWRSTFARYPREQEVLGSLNATGQLMLHIFSTCLLARDGRSEKRQKIDLSSNNEENLKFKLRYRKSIRRWPKFSAGNADLPLLPYPATFAILHNLTTKLEMDFSNFFSPPSCRKFPLLFFFGDEKVFPDFPKCYPLLHRAAYLF